MDLFSTLKDQIKGKNLKIVFPEGTDERVLKAAIKLENDKIVHSVVLGSTKTVKQLATKLSLPLGNVEIIDVNDYPEDKKQKMISSLVERRKGKTDEKTAEQWIKDPNYFGTMLVYMGLVDGMVSGAAHPTGDTVRPALQIIKSKPGVKLVSGSFIMQKGDQKMVFADCAINPELDASGMADVAISSGETAQLFGIDPKVAMLSFSTKGSAKGPIVEKVQKATELVHQRTPHLTVDGELQFDAAFVPSVAAKKAPDSDVAGHANVFIFPELQSANIGYKIAQRLGDFTAVGPILQGLNHPVSDLSRGCSSDDVYKVTLITAIQALENKQ